MAHMYLVYLCSLSPDLCICALSPDLCICALSPDLCICVFSLDLWLFSRHYLALWIIKIEPSLKILFSLSLSLVACSS